MPLNIVLRQTQVLRVMFMKSARINGTRICPGCGRVMVQRTAPVLPPASRRSAWPARACYGREDAQNQFTRVYFDGVSNSAPVIVFVANVDSERMYYVAV